ncbi:MAG: thioredoxin domain-containing protein, partial [Myxococcota bacterium]
PRFSLLLGLLALVLTPSAPDADPLRPRPQTVVVEHRPIADLPSLGPQHAPVTIDFFLTLRSSRRGLRLHRTLVALAERHPNRLRVVYRFVEDGGRTRMDEAAMEAYAQGKFVAFMDALGASPGQQIPVPNDKLRALCERIGIDFGRIEEAWESGRHLPVLEHNTFYRHQRRRAPALLLNGRAPRGVRVSRLDLDRLESAYDRAYDEAQTLIADGVAVDHIYQTSLRLLDADTPPMTIRAGSTCGSPPPLTSRTLDDAPLLTVQPSPGSHRIGPDNARVRIQLFCDFTCSYCGQLKRWLDRLRPFFPDQLELYFHHMISPDLDEDSAAESLRVHRAALCANEQGAFWRFYDSVYTLLTERRLRAPRAQPISDQLDRILLRSEIDILAFDTCMQRPDVAEKVMARVRASRKAGVTTVPTVAIGGRLYPGSKTEGELRWLIMQELKPGLLETLVPDE